MYAHLSNAPKRTGFKFVLLLTKCSDLSEVSQDMDSQELFFDSKTEAKKYAKSVNASPWNY